MLKRLLPLLFFWASVAGAQYVPFTLAAQQHGGTVGPSNFSYVASSVTGCWAPVASNTTCPYNLHINPSSGQLWIAYVIWHSTTATATFGCTNNTSWTAVASGIQNSGYTSQMFYLASAVAGANPEKCGPTISSGVSFISWEASAYTYTGTISGTDGTPQYSNATAVSNIATISGLTTSFTSSMLWGACTIVPVGCASGPGYTARNDTNACQMASANQTNSCGGGSTGFNFNTQIGVVVQDKVNVSPGAQSATFATTGATDVVTLQLIAF